MDLVSFKYPQLDLRPPRVLSNIEEPVVHDAAVVADRHYEYLMEKGPVRCQAPGDDGIFLQGSSLLALHHDNLRDPRTCREVKRLMRAALALYLGGRPLRTREVLRQLSSFSAAGRQATLAAGTVRDSA